MYQHIQRFLGAHLFAARLPGYVFPDFLRIRRELQAAGSPHGERLVFDRWRGEDDRTYRRVLFVHSLVQPQPVHLLDRSAHPVAPVEAEPDDTNWTALVAVCLRTLRDRERDIIMLRYGLFGSARLSLEAVGEKYGVSKERIRQIQDKAERRIRRNLRRLRNLPFDVHDADEE